ncbi:MAG: hypothetical protein QXS68_07675 [Candidatus Methanomethylicaceae archaeon]
MSADLLSRIYYLKEKLGIELPKSFQLVLPEWMISSSSAPVEFREELYQAGSKLGGATSEELKILLGQIVDSSTISIEKKLQLYKWISRDSGLIIKESKPKPLSEVMGNLNGKAPVVETETFLDILYGVSGVPRGLHILQGKPGSGKTSLLVDLAAALSTRGWLTLYVETELPLEVFAAIKLKKLFDSRRVDPEKFYLSTGSLDDEEIYRISKHQKSSSNSPSMLIIDSPDLLVGSGEVRSNYTDIYKQIARYREWYDLVFTVSHVRRKDRVLSLESLSEAWYKAWIADGVISINTNFVQSRGQMTLSLEKNRYGPRNSISVSFDFSENQILGTFGTQPGDSFERFVVEDSEDW